MSRMDGAGAAKLSSNGTMPYRYYDGGRAAAGYKGYAGDCVCRAISLVTEKPYQEVYDRLAAGNAEQRITRRRAAAGKRTAAHGINVRRQWFKDYMAELGLVWTPTMKIGQGCKVHLIADELPSGRLVVSVSKHYTAVIDGVIHDTHDPSDREPQYFFGPDGLLDLPKGARQLRPGAWIYDPARCVYGYWRHA